MNLGGELNRMSRLGVKDDTEKSPVTRGVLQYFPRALEEVAKVSAAGAKKYAWNGWKTVPDGITRYSDALGRHLLAEAQSAYDDGPDGTGCLHAAQVAWNALARLELILRVSKQPGVAIHSGFTQNFKDSLSVTACKGKSLSGTTSTYVEAPANSATWMDGVPSGRPGC